MQGAARKLVPLLAPLAWMTVIFAFSAMPSDGEDKGLVVLLTRKAAHFGEYFVLMLLWWWALVRAGLRSRALLGALALTVGYAVADELHQTFVDGRVGTWRDVLIDAAGALTATWAVVRLRRTRGP